MARSTSTNKAAKLAEKRSGRTIRFQGGVVFPLAVALTLIIGLGLIVYGRATLPDADASPPTIDDHWHAAYGFYLCDGWVQFNGNLEELDDRGQLISTNFRLSGIHSHDDGVMHWHPFTSRSVGSNAKLEVFLDSYEAELEDDRLTFASLSSIGPNPEYADQAPSEILEEYIEGETKCDGEDATLTVKAWNLFTDTDAGNRYIANMDQVHIDNDGMVFAIYFAPDDVDQFMPPWAENLPQLSSIDTNQIEPGDLLQTDSSVATDDSTTEDTSTEDSSTEDSSTEDSSTEDTSTEDSSTEDTSTEDSSTEDSSTDNG